MCRYIDEGTDFIFIPGVFQALDQSKTGKISLNMQQVNKRKSFFSGLVCNCYTFKVTVKLKYVTAKALVVENVVKT